MFSIFVYFFPVLELEQAVPMQNNGTVLSLFQSWLVTGYAVHCYDIKPVRKEEGKSYWKIPLCDDDATREK